MLIPELAVGRLVEEPDQISTLVQNYMDSYATFSKSDMASIASNDYMDGGQRAANHMGASADTSLIQSTFSSSLIPPVINAHNDVVYLAGHGNYNYIAPGFRAGVTGGGDTDDLSNMPNAMVAASGCHNGVNFGNRLYTATYKEFPEEFAGHQVGVYLGSTGYTWISGSGSSTNPAHTGWSERLATHFINHLLNDGMWSTAGKAFKAAVNEYVSDYGGIGNPHRRVLAIATLYGIPNYHPPRLIYVIPWWRYGFLVRRVWIKRLLPVGTQANATATPMIAPTAVVTGAEEITLEITDWYTDTTGLANIPGASYVGDYNVDTDETEPILPLVHATTVLPPGSNVVGVTWKQTESVSTTITNDVPLATIAVSTTISTGTYPYTDTFYPTTIYYTSTLATLGDGAVEVGLSIMPVQYYKPSGGQTGQTRIWTTTVFEVQYEVDEAELNADNDNDELPNYWELGYGLDPNDGSGDQGILGDPDQDGLLNKLELDLGTDPLDPDTDHDGSNDGQEVADGTDPLNPGSRLMHLYLPLVLRSYSPP